MSIEEHITTTVEQALTQVLGKITARLDALEQLQSASRRLLYREAEAAKLLGVSSATLKKWRCQGLVKAHTPNGARVPLYSLTNLERIVGQFAEGELGGV